MIKNSFIIKLIIFLLTIQLFTGCASAYITYSSSTNEIGIWNEPAANFTQLSKALSNDSILYHNGSIWYLNATIRQYGTGTRNFYINDSDVSELRIRGENQGIDLYGGYWYIENVTIGSWNYATNSYSTTNSAAYIEASIQKLQNVNFTHFGRVYSTGISNVEYYNITHVHGDSTALLLYKFNNSVIHDVYIEDCGVNGLDIMSSFNSEAYNITVIDAGNYTSPATGHYGIVVEYNGAGVRSENVTVHDCFVNMTGWSGVDTNSYWTTFYNITIKNAGHNGLDIHGGRNTTAYNISIYNSVSNNLYAIGENSSYTDIYSYYPTGDHVVILRDHSIFKNITMDSGQRGIVMFGTNDTLLMNLTKINSTGRPIVLTAVDGYSEPKNTTFIDADFSSGPIYFERCLNTKMINIKYDQYLGGITTPCERTFYYYPDIIVLDSNGNVSVNASIQLKNDVNPEFPCTDSYGNEKNIFVTDLNGRLINPISNRTNSPVIAGIYSDFSKNLQFYYTSTVTTANNRTISLSGITPDSSWYRKDPNIPTYTITAIIPNTSSTGPQIIGFAPAEDNPFNPGEKKNFRVWTNESLTEMLWYVDGSDSPVSKGSLNYTWNITEGNHTIKFIGSNANGTVNNTWHLGESSDEPSIPGGNPTQVIEFSPADSALTKNVSETVDFSVSPDVFTTKEWYVDGNLVLNNTVSMSKSWSTAGIYNVTFSGSGSEDVLHTWTVKVIEEPKEQNKSIITIAPEYQIIEPKKSFELNIKVEPGTPISGTQLDFVFNSSKTSVNNVTEGDLLKQSGAYTIFSKGTTDNSTGTVKNIYGFILGTSNVSTPGTMATVNLTAGSKTGIAEFSLSNVLISDADSKSVPYTVTNATVLIDTAPVMSAICCPKSVDEKSTLTFKVSAKDADCDRLTLSASGLPEGASFNKTSGNFTWTPAVGQAGVYTLTFEVSDGYLTDSENVTVTVNKLNNPPVINSFKPLNGTSFSEGERIEISVNASDAEGQALNYSIRIDGVACSTGTEYVWETDYSSSGNHTIEVVVSDGIDEVKQQHKIYISECRPRWDVNEDGVVNILDVTSVSQKCGTTVSKPYPRYDVNQDGAVNILDLTLVGNHFGELVK